MRDWLREREPHLVSVPVPDQSSHVSALHSSHWTLTQLIAAHWSRDVLPSLTTNISLTALCWTEPHLQFQEFMFRLAGVKLGVVVVESSLQLVNVLPQLDISLVLILVTGAVRKTRSVVA